MSHERALQKALIGHLRADAGVTALLGDRIRDGPAEGLALPHLTLGRCESRPVNADGGAIEHGLTLMIVSAFRGGEEAKAALASVRLALADVALEVDGVRTVSLGVRHAEVWPAVDGRRTFAALRVRAVTEQV